MVGRMTRVLAGVGWKLGWWLRSRSRSHEGDRKPRSKLRPVASALKFRKLKPNPVDAKVMIWKLKPKPVISKQEKWEAEAEAKHVAGGKAHCSHDMRLRKAKSE